MSERYLVSLQIDRIPDQPDNPEAIGDPVVVASFVDLAKAKDFVKNIQLVRKIIALM